MKSFHFLFVFASILVGNAFFSPLRPIPSSRGNLNFNNANNLQMTQIDVIGKHMEITPAIRNHLNEKLDHVFSKVGRNVNSAHVVLHCEKYNGDQAQIVEVTANMKGGATVRATVDNDNDMYAAIDKVSHILSNNLKKHSETHNSLNAKRKHQKVLKVAVDSSEDSDEILFDVEQMPELEDLSRGAATLDRLTMFSKEAISVDDATNCLKKEGHQFYAFRNKATKEVNIVYFMKNGDVGIIQPADQTLLKFANEEEELKGEAFTLEDEVFPKIAHHDSY